tara:strand:+ start:799 stop:2202 length:1404 start_codon:yes stop_codon:yes gene_type:complete
MSGQINKRKPMNIIWIVAEDLSPDLNCYGNGIVKTPNLDSLAVRGMRFNNAFTVGPVCAPSRTALITGMYHTSIGSLHMRYPNKLMPELPKGIKTIAQLSKNKGYTSANIQDYPATGKLDWMFVHDVKDNFNAFGWKELDKGKKPFFALLSLGLTHRPFVTPEKNQFDLDKIIIPPYYPDKIITRKEFASYYATIEKLDQQVGAVLDSLRKYNLEDNTMIIFTSDHGRPMTKGKYFHYDSGTKIPLIICAPENAAKIYGYKAGSVSNQLISSIDLAATSLSLLEIDKPDYMQGKIFLGRNKDAQREYVFSAINRISGTDFRSRSIRSHNYRYIRNYHHNFSVNSSSTYYRRSMHPIYHLLNILNERGELTEAQKALVDEMPYEELYEITSDPYETKNLAKSPNYLDVLDGMRYELDIWIDITSDLGLCEDNYEIKKTFADFQKKSSQDRSKKIDSLRLKVLSELDDN